MSVNERRWTKLLGHGRRVEIVGGAYDGQQGGISAVFLENPIAYLVLLDNGVEEKFTHESLRGLDSKDPRIPLFPDDRADNET